MCRLAAWLCVMSLLVFGGLAEAQEVADAGSDRHPRFLLAVGNGGPVPIDVSRTAVLMRRLALDLNGVTLREALTAIGSRSGLRLVYNDDVVPLSARVHLRADDIAVAAALMDVLLDTGIDVVFHRDGHAALVKRVAAATLVQTGTVTGRVTDSTNSEGIGGVTVMVDGTRSTTTAVGGNYMLRGVPIGARTISARRLGYRTQSRTLTVSEDSATRADFVLVRAPTVLSEVVATATGDRARLEVGNAIGTIKADSIVPTTLIRNLSDLLTARTPGVIVSNTTGAVGAPSKVRLRGQGSVYLNNDPIVIVDGARVFARITSSNSESDAETGLVSTRNVVATQGSAGGVQAQFAPSALDDIDPNTIESIDILRGPSASSLYGTEAANGVIVIKTKRGVAGAFRSNVSADQGWSSLPGKMPLQWSGWGRLPNGTVTRSCRLGDNGLGHPNVAEGSCVQDSVTAFNAANDPQMTTIGKGRARNVSAGLSGGSDQVTQALSLRWSDNLGVAKMSEVEKRRLARMWGGAPPSWMIRPNTESAINGSSRTVFRPSSRLDVSLSANAVYRSVLSSQPATPLNFVAPGGPLSAPAGAWDTLTFLPSEVQRAKQTTVAKRSFASASANFVPYEWLSLRGVIGGDYTVRTQEALVRASDCTALLNVALGCRSGRAIARGETFVTTIDVGAHFSFRPRDWLALRSSLGEQYSRTSFSRLEAKNGSSTNLGFGAPLLTPTPVPVSGNPQLFQVAEGRDESATAGWYVEQMVAWRDRLFVTAALRSDAASAFGRNVNQHPPSYPKASLSWLASDETYFPLRSIIPSLRLRIAYGHSGTQASQADKLNRYTLGQAVENGVVAPAIQLSRLGNPDLRPERTKEWEGGIDASFLRSERVRIELTSYKKLSKDAIMATATPGSYGMPEASQLVNVGSVENRGIELFASGHIIDTRSVSWHLSAIATRNRSRLVSASPGLRFPAFSQLRVGFPLSAVAGPKMLSYADRNGDGILTFSEVVFSDTAVYIGSGLPDSDITYANAFTFFSGALHVSATLNHALGLLNSIEQLNSLGLVGQRCAYDRSCSLSEQATLMERSLGGGSGTSGKTSMLRFSELSLTYRLTARHAGRYLHARSAAITVAGRNLALWTNYIAKDPNVNAFSDNVASDNGSVIPQTRNWIVRLNLGF